MATGRYGTHQLPPTDFSTQPTMSTLIQEMSQCLDPTGTPTLSPLGPGNDANKVLDRMCQTNALSQEEVENIADEVIENRIINKYLKGSTAPLTAMLERKKTRASSVLQTTSDSLEDLQNDADSATENFNAARADVGIHTDGTSITGGAKDKADQAVNAYRTAVGDIFAIDSAWNEWNRRAFPEYTDASENRKSINNLITDNQSVQQELQSLQEKFTHALDAQNQNKKALKKMCAIWFCEILALKNKTHRRTICDDHNFRGNNPLCQGIDATINVNLDGQTTETRIDQVCYDYAGFDPAWITENRNVAAHDQCFTDDSINPKGSEIFTNSSDQQWPEDRITLSWYTDYTSLSLDRVYVAIMNSSNEKKGYDDTTQSRNREEKVAVKLQDCNLEKARSLLGLQQPEPGISSGHPVDDTAYNWIKNIWDSIVGRPFISCLDKTYDTDKVYNGSTIYFTKNLQERARRRLKNKTP